MQSPPQPCDDDDGDLNKTLGVQRFQQILSPAQRMPAEQHRTFNEEDFECENFTHATLPFFVGLNVVNALLVSIH